MKFISDGLIMTRIDVRDVSDDGRDSSFISNFIASLINVRCEQHHCDKLIY